jgi:hypothetical protein
MKMSDYFKTKMLVSDCTVYNLKDSKRGQINDVWLQVNKHQCLDASHGAKAVAHAINSHDKLVEALEGLINDIDINHHIRLENMIGGSTREALAVAQEALKQAKGEE